MVSVAVIPNVAMSDLAGVSDEVGIDGLRTQPARATFPCFEPCLAAFFGDLCLENERRIVQCRGSGMQSGHTDVVRSHDCFTSGWPLQSERPHRLRPIISKDNSMIRCTRRVALYVAASLLSLGALGAGAAIPVRYLPAVQAQPASVGDQNNFDCSTDVMFIGARGSGELASDSGGLGRTVASQRDRLAENLASRGRSLSTTAIVDPGYPANPVPLIGGKNPDLPGFAAGIEEGVQATLQFLRKWKVDTACRGQRLVLAGYSQGAMVMHRVAYELTHAIEAPFENYEYIVEQIDGVILLADGDRKRDDSVIYGIGNAPTDRGGGVGQVAPLLSLAASGYLSAQWRDKIISICRLNDPVCAYEPPRTFKYNDFHFTIHGDGYRDAGWLKTAADWVKFVFPPDRPVIDGATMSISTAVGVPVSHPLGAMSGNRCAVKWYLAGVFAMPRGLRLLSAGTVEGTPTVGGTYNVSVKANSTCPVGRAPSGVTTSLTITVSEVSQSCRDQRTDTGTSLSTVATSDILGAATVGYPYRFWIPIVEPGSRCARKVSSPSLVALNNIGLTVQVEGPNYVISGTPATGSNVGWPDMIGFDNLGATAPGPHFHGQLIIFPDE